jgi:cell division protein FtsW (lipid II flippase)
MVRAQFTIIDAWRYRRLERSLFFWSFLSIVLGYVLVVVRKTGKIPVHWQDYLPLLVYLGAMLTIHLILVLLKFRGDPLLLAAVFFLAGFGMLTQFRMGTFELIISDKLSTYAFPAGLALMLIVTVLFRRGRFRILQPLAIPCLLLAAILLGAILFLGQRYRGAMFLPGYINPADLIKILLMVFLAGYFARGHKAGAHAPAGFTSLIPLLLFWAVPMVLLLLQRDLGMLVLLNAVLLVLLVLATGRASYLIMGILGSGALGAAVFLFSAHGQARFTAWLTPFADPTGKSWQILQALSAMYSGGLWGVGLGGGSPQFIPIASSDFIYAVIGEELGFAGCGIVLVFYLVLFFRGYQIAERITAPFGRLLATGIVTTLAFQTLLNICGVVKALPLTGITLPFISHGGSSLLTTFLGVGLLLAISERETETRKIIERPKATRAKRKRTAEG